MALSPTTSPLSLAFPTQSVAPTARSFVDFDERVTTLGSGIVIVRAPSDAIAALVAHAVRRVRAAGLATVTGRPQRGAPLWQQIAARLSIGELSCEPASCAEQIVEAASARRTVIITPLPREGTWDRAVAAEMTHLASTGLVVIVADAADGAQDIRGDKYDVGATLDPEERRRWWAALVDDGSASAPERDLADLHDWWTARKQALDAPTERPTTLDLPSSARALFAALALAARPWPESAIAELGAGFGGALRELATLGAVAIDRGWVAVDAGWDAAAAEIVSTASSQDRARVAHVLAARARVGNDAEPWALARAAELFAAAGDVEAADKAYAAAIAKLDDTTARREVVSRWMDAVELVPAEAQLALRCRAAEQALSVGEAEEAHRWAKTASSLAREGTAEAATVTMLIGRSAVALGDLVTARVALERGRATARGRDAVSAIAVELAEVHYLSGERSAAEREASTAMSGSTDPSLRLRARNILGKLLLADAKWDEADRHFAEDTEAATEHGDHTAKMRARLNRGIAVLSKGLTDGARAIFEGVLEDGKRAGDARACAFALDNLAVVATIRQDYMLALDLYEQTLKLRRRLGDRPSMAHVLANLADLRFKLGLLEQADHTVAFGRRTLGASMGLRGNTLSVIAARVALERGNSAQARREAARALVHCEAIGDLVELAIAYRVSTRVALDDGDLARAAQALAKARELTSDEEGLAEVALLDAQRARAAGEPPERTVTLGGAALALARTANHESLQREAHVLLCEVHRAADDHVAARAHLDHAIALRDRLAQSLRADVRDAFLSQPSIALLTRLAAALSPSTRPEPDGDPDDDGARTQRPGSLRMPVAMPREPREIVGDDPAIRGLLAAIRKVARSNATVLVRGESGTGKELVAEALHRASDRANGPLVTVNCAALVETLLLSELFGHEKGAFTGAFARRRGRFELAEGGTLFLDEIGDISSRTQVALLRVLQERTFERVGGTAAIRANVRIICATHRDLRAMVERGEFREDLYYRLRGITLEVPALRTRMGDVPRIATSLLERIALERSETPKTLTVEALDLLARHRWPGNIRELENALRAASLFAEDTAITLADLADNVDDLRPLAGGGPISRPGVTRGSSPPPAPISDSDASTAADDDAEAPLPVGEASATQVAYAQVRQGTVSLSDIKRQIERDCIARALAETKGNITRAAAILGMKRPRLSQLVKQYGLAAVSSEAQ